MGNSFHYLFIIRNGYTQHNRHIKNMPMIILAIDPSIKKMGYAIFSSFPAKPGYITSGLIKPSPGDDWVAQVDLQVSSISAIYARHKPSLILIELPRPFQSAKGQAAQNSGAILKLMFLVATLRATYLPLTQVQLVPVNTWKGTVPKHITARRVQKHWGINIDDMEDDETDAIGIADWYIRKSPNP